MEWRSKQPRDKVVSRRSSNRGKGQGGHDKERKKEKKTNIISTSLPSPLHWLLPSYCQGADHGPCAPYPEHLGAQSWNRSDCLPTLWPQSPPAVLTFSV